PGALTRIQTREALPVVKLRRLFSLEVQVGRVFPGGEIEESRHRTVRRTVPVGRSLRPRIDQGALSTGLNPRRALRTPLLVETGVPVCLHKTGSQEKLPAEAVQDIKPAVAIGEQNGFARMALKLEIREHGHLRRNPVEFIVRGKLIVP